MKLGLRIFACYIVIFCICFAYPATWVLDTLRTRYLEGVEDPLVDQANILAGLLAPQLESGRFDPQALRERFASVYDRRLDARIYNLTKTSVDVWVYVTDAGGKVIFHSRDPGQIGRDYGHWRDVGLTLEGRYGARTSLADPDDMQSSVLHIAAPVTDSKGRIAGVVTVAKPTTNINSFLQQAKPQLIKTVSLSAAAAIVLGYLVALWITRPIQRMTAYAKAVHAGQRVAFPPLDRTEIGAMGRALRKMQAALEGKAYVERYVQQLTHEIKSPLSAIRGAAELLEEEVPAPQRKTFLNNIRTEANRIRTIVDHMLTLAALENKQALPAAEPVPVDELVEEVIRSKTPILLFGEIAVSTGIEKHIRVRGDRFWLHQAVSNLVQNAIDFSPRGGTLTLVAHIDQGNVRLSVENSGDPIPDYALEKVFDKFYSLKRPGSGRKSTGLGLNLVKQVALLHNGTIELHNTSPGGVRAVLTLPRSEPKMKIREKLAVK
jgi:two-component system sensor histidine kinase CreC